MFEFEQENHAKSKSLSFEAIISCPWSKQLHLMPFVELRHLFDVGELGSRYHIMMEKELRLRSDLERAFEGFTPPAQKLLKHSEILKAAGCKVHHLKGCKSCRAS